MGLGVDLRLNDAAELGVDLTADVSLVKLAELAVQAREEADETLHETRKQLDLRDALLASGYGFDNRGDDPVREFNDAILTSADNSRLYLGYISAESRLYLGERLRWVAFFSTCR